MTAIKIEGLFCDSCQQVHLNPTQEEKSKAASWGFFLCGMANKPHKGETTIRNSVIINGQRLNLHTGEVIKA